MYNIKEVSARIKDLREFSDYSIEDFAQKVGITPEEYAEYESGEKDIPIGLLYNISTVLEIDPTYVLFGKGATKRDATAVYGGNGISIQRYEGYSFISLNADFVDRELEPMIVTIEEGVTPELVKHTGQEFNYVLEGSLRVIVGEKEYYLRSGDSLYFDATLPHAQVAMEKFAKFITVIQR